MYAWGFFPIKTQEESAMKAVKPSRAAERNRTDEDAQYATRQETPSPYTGICKRNRWSWVLEVDINHQSRDGACSRWNKAQTAAAVLYKHDTTLLSPLNQVGDLTGYDFESQLILISWQGTNNKILFVFPATAHSSSLLNLWIAVMATHHFPRFPLLDSRYCFLSDLIPLLLPSPPPLVFPSESMYTEI